MYPDDWPEISQRIRQRDGWRCQWCGATEYLGVAHLDHEPANCDDANLLTLCWPCHQLYDAKTGAKHPGKNARRLATRRQNQARKDVDPLRRVVFTDGRMIRYMPGAPRK